MGLRERASDYSKTVEKSSGVDLGLELRPDLNASRKNNLVETRAPAQPTAPTIGNEINPPVAQPAVQVSADAPALGHKARLDAVLNLIEIYKEFGHVHSATDLWQVVGYALMAQLGTRYIAIFMESDARMELKYALGFTMAADYSFAANNTLAQTLAREKKVLYLSDILATLPEREAKFIDAIDARYAAPVFRYEELRGVLFVKAPQERTLLNADELFYLKISGELLGAMEAQLALVASAEEEKLQTSRNETYRQYANDFVAALGQRDNDEPLKDVLEAELTRHFPETALLLMTREDFFLRRHYAIGFSSANVGNLEVNLIDPIIERVKNGQNVFTTNDFDGSEAFAFLSRYRQIFAHKVLHRREILALAFIADDDLARVAALRSMLDQYVTQNHIAKLRDHATNVLQHADNPIVAIRNFIGACEEYLTKAQEPYAVIVSNIVNFARLENLHGDAFATEIRDFTRRTLREIMETQDFSTEAFHGHFISVLRQKEAGDAWRLSRVLQKQAGKLYADEDFRPLYQHKIYARPHLQLIPFELLFKG